MQPTAVSRAHYPVRSRPGNMLDLNTNTYMEGSFCKRCLNWSNMSPNELRKYECLATKEEAKANRKFFLSLEGNEV